MYEPGRVSPQQPAQSILGNLNQISYQIHQKSGHTLLCIDHKTTRGGDAAIFNLLFWQTKKIITTGHFEYLVLV